jgi:hypothetical protein
VKDSASGRHVSHDIHLDDGPTITTCRIMQETGPYVVFMLQSHAAASDADCGCDGFGSKQGARVQARRLSRAGRSFCGAKREKRCGLALPKETPFPHRDLNLNHHIQRISCHCRLVSFLSKRGSGRLSVRSCLVLRHWAEIRDASTWWYLGW